MAKQVTEEHKHLFKRGKVWWIQVMRKGEHIVKSTGETDLKKARIKRDEELNPLHLKDVKKRAVAVYEKVRTADDGLREELSKLESKAPATTISTGWQAYLAQSNRPDSGESTLRQYEFQYEAFAGWFLDNHDKVDKDNKPIRWELRHVTQSDVDHYTAHLIKKVSPTTYNRHVVLLALVWRVLEKTARLQGNPWKGIERKRFAVHSRRELSVDELGKVFNAAQGEMRLLLGLGTFCGLRLGDAANLQWSNVDLVKGSITLIPRKTARRLQKRITLPIHPALRLMLEDTPRGNRHGLVMPEMSERYDLYGGALAKDVARLFLSVNIKTGANALTKAEKDALKVTKAQSAEQIPVKPTSKGKAVKESRASADCGFHSLRHTFVSLCAAGGVSQSVVQSLVGHGSPAMTQHYTHIDIETSQRAVAMLPDVTRANTLPESVGAAQDGKSALLAIVAGMTAETWEADRSLLAKLIGGVA